MACHDGGNLGAVHQNQNLAESSQIKLNHWHYANAADHVGSSCLRSFHIQITKLIGLDSRFGQPISGPPCTNKIGGKHA